jgi:hypothetical protein
MSETLENRPHLAERNAAGHSHELFRDAYQFHAKHHHAGHPKGTGEPFTAQADAPSPPPESWTQTLVNFGNTAHLYESSKTQKHPFTAAEIAQAGTISSVELNSELQNNMSVLANDSPSRVPSSALEAALNQSDMRIMGLYSGADANGNMGNSGQVREAVLANSSQSGSAGVDQFALNDCSFESAVASMASTKAGQKAIAQMITQNNDGSYTVQFPGANRPITVTEQDLKNPALGNSAAWANVLEAASFNIDPQTAEKGASGELIADYMSLLTGHETDGIDLTGRKETDVAAELKKLLAHGAVIEGGDARPGVPLEQGHAYSILKLTGDTLTVRNPWGNNVPLKGCQPGVGETQKGVVNLGGGELSMSVQTYMADLPGLFYSEQK